MSSDDAVRVHDTSDVEPLEDDDHEASDYEDDVSDYEENPNDSQQEQRCYIVLGEADIRQCIADDIANVCTVLSISRVEAGILLRHYNWVVSKVHEEWFADEESVRKAVGLLEKPVIDLSNAAQLTCGICFEAFPKDDIHAAACGHPYCSFCWAGYISTAINDGPGCLALRCPDPGCRAAVGQDMVDALGGSEDDRTKYFQYFLRSYVEQNKAMKWCPAPGCEFAVRFDLGSGTYDVSCSCSYNFCWNCAEEAHRPVDCAKVSKWIIKNSWDSQNATWIMANSKPCPKCGRPIEKNQGCNHMTCPAPCGYDFCWFCLGDLGGGGGAFFHKSCNGYRTEGGIDEEQRNKAKIYLHRYGHYYERWANNHSSRRKAIADRQQMQDVHLATLSKIQCVQEMDLDFILKAWSQIVICRRVLKWTYAYGYYLPQHPDAKVRLFEYLQGEAEASLERLHHCAETELQRFLTAQAPSEDFNKFRANLINRTKVTGNYFENLVRALENGLSETNGLSEADSKPVQEADHDEDVVSYWSCDRCTYLNPASQKACRMCNLLLIGYFNLIEIHGQ